MEQFLQLKRQRMIRRIAEGAVALLSLTLLIVFTALKAKSKVLTKTEVTPFFSHDTVHYTKDSAVGILISGLIFVVFVSAFVADLLRTRICYAEIDGEDVIVYNGLGLIKLLVNGEEKDAMFFKGYLETKLNSGVTMTVSPQFYLSYHITFSDNCPAMDL